MGHFIAKSYIIYCLLFIRLNIGKYISVIYIYWKKQNLEYKYYRLHFSNKYWNYFSSHKDHSV